MVKTGARLRRGPSEFVHIPRSLALMEVPEEHSTGPPTRSYQVLNLVFRSSIFLSLPAGIQSSQSSGPLWMVRH